MNATTYHPVSVTGKMSLQSRLSSLRFVLLLLLAQSSLADEMASDNFRLIELFTSHGCSSCPAAESLLGELLAEDKQLLALEFHVDYWDDLVHGSDGNFVDPFSDASYSMRQREYNVASLAGRPGVYTPQAVINGRFATVGSNRRDILRALTSTEPQSLKIQVDAGQTSDTLSVVVTGSAEQRAELAGINISVARYLDSATTSVTGGENRHKSLTNHRIVTSLTILGEVSEDNEMSFTLQKPAENEGCVVLVQEDASTPVYAANACP